MGFASTYLESRALFNELINEAPESQTGIIVIVPAYDEPGIGRLLDSLAQCSIPECGVEVMIVINALSDAFPESIENNNLTIKNIESWKKENSECFFRLFVFIADNRKINDWGVGLARKTGMDEAVRRFNFLDKPEGIILNLDADCKVDRNYFISVLNGFRTKRSRSACSIYFEHPLSGNDFPEDVYKYIAMYELHLRYYYQGLAYCGFPYVFHTVGSAIALKALSYVKAGGMNRRQAGEDFYFIQKLVPAGGYFNLNSTTVYPSPRASSRVPFGTGASIGKMTSEKMSVLHTYNLLALKELKLFFDLVGEFFLCTDQDLHKQYNLFPEGIKLFLDEKEWMQKLSEIKMNTSGLTSFKKRFFGWFNMFKIVKYLNFVHSGKYEKQPVQISAGELLENIGKSTESTDTFNLLLQFRVLEKNS